MRYLICYDIADDRRRERVATVLLNYGKRLQESVFLCEQEADLRDRMVEQMQACLEITADRLVLAPLCQSCWAAVRTWGPEPKPEAAAYYLY